MKPMYKGEADLRAEPEATRQKDFHFIIDA
jgi:hypothetical protein